MISEETSLQRILQEKFGLSDFRKGQLDIIQSVLRGKDTLAVMPTGGGKSLCYQLPAIATEGIVVVVSPLIALMKDQVRGLKRLGIPAGCVHSGQPLAEKQAVFADLKRSRTFLLYLSPERVQKTGFESWIKDKPISLFAIDEAHCVSQWGPEFRPDYHRLSKLRELKPQVPILALTATATPQVLTDVHRQLGLRSAERHIHGFYRPNLYYQVEYCDDAATRFRMVRQALRQTPSGRCLVYCGTRRQCEELVNELGSEIPEMGYYHAGLDAEERTRIQKEYEDGKIRILACTNAFGMGIDHPDVRLVVHFQMPANIESFYQEMGRAGRDGQPSTCLLLYAKKDRGLHSYFIQQSEASGTNIASRWRALEAITDFAEGGECRHAGILTYFKDAFRLQACGHCDICDPDSERRVRAESEPVFTPRTVVRKRKSRAAGKALSDEPLSADAELREEMLREWRKRYADEHDIAAFMVFSNKTLRDLALKNPKSMSELERVYGFGPHKVEHLGTEILAELASCR